MINQKKSKKIRMDSRLLKQLSKDMKTMTENKNQPTSNHKK